jgi:two-component system sensor histidine kinase KdpD
VTGPPTTAVPSGRAEVRARSAPAATVVARGRQVVVTVAMACGPVALAVVVGLLIDATITVAVLLLLPAVTAAGLLGRAPGALAAMAGAAALSYWHIPPVRVFSLGKPDEALALVVFLAVAMVVATLVEAARSAERSAAAARLREAEAEARSAVQASRAAFFAAAGHNLRTPLAGIRAAAEALADVERPEDARELRTGIVTEVDRLGDLIGRILTLSRASAGADLLELRGDVDLPGLAADVVDRVARATAGDITWDVDVAAGPGLQLDGLAVEQVLQDLLENAARYAPAGTAVQVTGRLHAEGYRLAVADRGPGVPPDLREAVFEPFRSDRSGPGGGGLGLAIARALVVAHGGRLELVDDGRAGAAFAATFPVAGAA